MGFSDFTRRQVIPLTTFQRTTTTGGNVQRFDVPRAAILGRFYLSVRTAAAPGTVTVLTTYGNTVGNAGLIRRIRVVSNNGQDIYNVSGPGYFYIFAPYIDFPGNTVLGAPGTGAGSTAKSAITTSNRVNIDMVIPIALNLRDEVGLFPLQNEQTLVTFIIEWETTTVLAAVITFGANDEPIATLYEETFTIPPDQSQLPSFGMVHQILEDQTVVSASGILTYPWPRGNVVLQMLHGFTSSATVGFGLGATSDGWTRGQLRANQSTYIHDSNPDFMDMQNAFTRLQVRGFGVIPFDYLGTSGMGNYDQLRDVINTRQLTDLATLATLTASGTFYSIRRQLVPV